MTRINDLFVQGMENMGLDSGKVELSWKEDILILSGEMDTWQQVVDVGHMAAKLAGVTKLVNHLTSKDQPPKAERDLSPYFEMDEINRAEVVIIGAGVTGCGIA